MRRFLLVAALAAVTALPSGTARAITFPAGTSDGQFVVVIAGVLTGLFLPIVQEARREAALTGSLTLDLEEIGRRSASAGNTARESVLFTDILDFDLNLSVPTDAQNGTANVRLTPETGAVEIVNPGWFTDGLNLIIDSSGQPPNTPIVQFTIDKFDEPIGFPDGRRVGDDALDIVLAQLFTGSVNFGVAALPDGFTGDPAFVGVTQLTPDDAFVFGTLDDVAAVPLPPTAPLFLGALAALWAARRRR